MKSSLKLRYEQKFRELCHSVVRARCACLRSRRAASTFGGDIVNRRQQPPSHRCAVNCSNFDVAAYGGHELLTQIYDPPSTIVLNGRSTRVGTLYCAVILVLL